jgi:hypothetical protein
MSAGIPRDANAHTAILRRSQPPARFRTVPDTSGPRQAPRHSLRSEHPLPGSKEAVVGREGRVGGGRKSGLPTNWRPGTSVR